MMLLVNLPNTQDGEDTQGVAMLTVKDVDGMTLVSLFMTRIYYWFSGETNSLREQRSTPEFRASRRASYKEDFLLTLKGLAENREQ